MMTKEYSRRRIWGVILVIAIAALVIGATGAGTLARFSDSNSMVVSINASDGFDSQPIAEIDSIPSEVTMNEEVDLNASGSWDDVGIQSYRWSVDGDKIGNGEHVTRSFGAPGTYTIEVTVNDTFGQTNSTSRNVQVVDTTPPSPSLEVSETSIVVSEAVAFDASNSSDNHAISSYRWELGDNTTKNGSTISHSYDSTGSYSVTLAVTDKSGNTATQSVTISVSSDDPPTASVNAQKTRVGIGESVELTAQNSTDDDGIASYEWNSGGETFATGPTATRAWDEPGSYTVTVTVTDTGDQTDTASMNISVEDQTAPSASISADPVNVSVNSSVNFSAASSTDNVGIVEYSWDFDDESSGSGEEVTHSFGSTGEYIVTLTVKDSAGNSDTAQVTIQVHD